MTAALQIVRHADADAFLEAAQRWLLEAEAENNFLLGIALNVQLRPASEARLYFAGIHERNEGARSIPLIHRRATGAAVTRRQQSQR